MVFVFLYPVFIAIVLLITLYLFYHRIYTPYRLRTTNNTFSELIDILSVTINSELDLYERNVFNTKGAITNSNFDNYYYDICESIQGDLSDIFIIQMRRYLNEDAIYSMITRQVRIYLTNKIKGTI
jgi:hypothetical protein